MFYCFNQPDLCRLLQHGLVHLLLDYTWFSALHIFYSVVQIKNCLKCVLSYQQDFKKDIISEYAVIKHLFLVGATAVKTLSNRSLELSTLTLI